MRGNRTHRDLFDFATRLANDPTLPISVQTAAQIVVNRHPTIVTHAWSDVNRPGWSGLNIWLEMNKVALQQNIGGGVFQNTALSNQYLATDFANAAVQWHRMLTTIAGTPGVRFSLSSNRGELFELVLDSQGNRVGYLGSDLEDCRFCSSDVLEASCYQNIGSNGHSEIFIPTTSGNYQWFVDGSLITSPADFTLTLQSLSDNLVVRTEEVRNGTIQPGQVISGTFSMAMQCVPGNVNSAQTAPVPTLFVNGSSGNDLGFVEVRLGEPIRISMINPPSRASSTFALYSWLGEPTASTTRIQPRNLGTMCFPTPLNLLQDPNDQPQPFKIWNNIGRENQLGVPNFSSQPASSTVLSLPNGLNRETTLTFQGIIRDVATNIPEGFSVTNAVILKVVQP